MKKLIDDVYKLMKLPNEELDEVLLDEKYNKALLRELVRRTLRVAQNYKFSLESDGKELLNINNRTVELQKDIQIAIDKFNNSID